MLFLKLVILPQKIISIPNCCISLTSFCNYKKNHYNPELLHFNNFFSQLQKLERWDTLSQGISIFFLKNFMLIRNFFISDYMLNLNISGLMKWKHSSNKLKRLSQKIHFWLFLIKIIHPFYSRFFLNCFTLCPHANKCHKKTSIMFQRDLLSLQLMSRTLLLIEKSSKLYN